MPKDALTAHQLLLQALLSATLVGAIIGTILKFVFDRAIERGRASLQHDIEETKALLQRASAVHAKQVDALTELYAILSEIKVGIVDWAGQSNDPDGAAERRDRVRADRSKAEASFRTQRLLLPVDLETDVEKFLDDLPWIMRGLAAKELGKQSDSALGLTQSEFGYTPLDPEVNSRLTLLLKRVAEQARKLIHTT